MVTSYRADKRLAAVPELANLVCMEFAAQDVEPPTPVVNNIVTALVDARRWLVGRGSNADETFQDDVGMEDQRPLPPPPVQSSAGQSAAESSFSLQLNSGAVPAFTDQDKPVLEPPNKIPRTLQAAYVTDVLDEAFTSKQFNATTASDDGQDVSEAEELDNLDGDVSVNSSSPASRSLKDMRSTISIDSIDEDDPDVDSLVHEGYEGDKGEEEESDIRRLNSFESSPASSTFSKRTTNRYKMGQTASEDPDHPDDADDPDDPDDPDDADDPNDADDPDDSDDPDNLAGSRPRPSTSGSLSANLNDQITTRRKRTKTHPNTGQPKKKPKIGSQPARQVSEPCSLATAFGTGNVKARILAMRQDWDRLSRSRVLHEVVMPQLATYSQPADGPRYFELFLWHGQQLDKNTLEGQLHSLQNRIDLANYHSLYKMAVQDVRQNKDPTFFQWTDELLRQRGKTPQTKRSGRGYRVTCAVIDRLVEIHSTDVTFSRNRSKAQMKRKIEKWKERGETWFELINHYGVGVMALVPPNAIDTHYIFTKTQRKEFLTALAVRKPELEDLLCDAKYFMTECFYGSQTNQGAKSVSAQSDHSELTFRERETPEQSARRNTAAALQQQSDPSRTPQAEINNSEALQGSPVMMDEYLPGPLANNNALTSGSHLNPSRVQTPSFFDDAWPHPSMSPS